MDDGKEGPSNNRASDDGSSSGLTNMLDAMDGVTESRHNSFVSDFDDGSIGGPGRMSAMSVEDDGSSFFLSQSFAGSTVTELSSIFSMSEDDFDKMASRHARLLFDDIDSMLFERQTDGPPHLLKECLEWQTKFPHLRVLGHRIMDYEEEGFHLYPAMSSALTRLEDINVTSASNDLLIHGKHFDVAHPGLVHSISSLANVEEVLEENGTMEEIFAIDYRLGDDDFQTSGRKHSSGHPPITPFSCVKDNIVSSLFNHLLIQVFPTFSPLLLRILETAAERKMPDFQSGLEPADDLQLSINSINCSEKNSRSTAFSNSVLSSVPENAALDGLLTIRSKTLLNRERTMGILDGLTETSLHSQTMPIVRLNPALFCNGHLNERRSSLNRIKLLPLENARLQSLVPPAEIDLVGNTNLDGLRGHRLAAISGQNSATPAPKLPPLQSQRTIMSANVPNTIINRSMQSNRRISQRAISAIQEKDVSVPYREKDRASLALDLRPTTTQAQYGSEKKNDNGQTVGRQSAASLLPLNVAHRPSTALSAKMAGAPSLVLSGNGITPRKTEKSDSVGGESSPTATGQLNLARRGSGPFDDIIQMANRWNPIHLARGKIYKNLQGGSTPPSSQSRLLQLRPSQHKATVS